MTTTFAFLFGVLLGFIVGITPWASKVIAEGKATKAKLVAFEEKEAAELATLKASIEKKV